MQYRRDYTKGASYFFTVVTFHRAPLFNQAKAVSLLRDAFRQEKIRRPFTIDAIVIMPDHLHALWTLPKDDADYSIRWRNIKRSFTLSHSKQFNHAQDKALRLWQPRFWEHRIRDEQSFNQHVDYIHYNPVKHGFVSHPVDWAYSSIHRYIREQIIGADWGSIPINLPDKVGYE